VPQPWEKVGASERVRGLAILEIRSPSIIAVKAMVGKHPHEKTGDKAKERKKATRQRRMPCEEDRDESSGRETGAQKATAEGKKVKKDRWHSNGCFGLEKPEGVEGVKTAKIEQELKLSKTWTGGLLRKRSQLNQSGITVDATREEGCGWKMGVKSVWEKNLGRGPFGKLASLKKIYLNNTE